VRIELDNQYKPVAQYYDGPLPIAVEEPKVIVANGYVYVLEGNKSSLYSDNPSFIPNTEIQYAKIDSNGTLGDFQIASTQLNGTGYSYIFSDADYIYVFGGIKQNLTVESTTIALKIDRYSGDVSNSTDIGSNFGSEGIAGKGRLGNLINNIINSPSVRLENINKLNNSNYTGLSMNVFNQLVMTCGDKTLLTNSMTLESIPGMLTNLKR